MEAKAAVFPQILDCNYWTD